MSGNNGSKKQTPLDATCIAPPEKRKCDVNRLLKIEGSYSNYYKEPKQYQNSIFKTTTLEALFLLSHDK
jgi:hypothetical protein